MRLQQKEIEVICKILNSFSKNGEIYLHGSRLNDLQRGGDIDLFFIVEDEEKEFLINLKYQIIAQLSLQLREQKVDLVILSKSASLRDDFFLNSSKKILN